MDPILKWAGGKRRLASEIKALFPSDIEARAYHEPFFGGGAIYFNILPRAGSINDINKQLMNFYIIVRDKPQQLIDLANQYEHNEEIFYKLRDKYNQPDLTDVEYASLLLYLNKTAFNGLYRVNSKGKFNVPFGRYTNPTIVPEDRIRLASKVLRNVDIFNKDFEYVLDIANYGDVVYFDPPYQPINSTANFTSYSSKGFSYEDQVRLRDLCIKLDKNGVYFVLSNSFSPESIELYEDAPGFRTEVVQARRAISSKASTRGPIFELLVTNVPSSLSKEDIVLQYRFKRFKKESKYAQIIEKNKTNLRA